MSSGITISQQDILPAYPGYAIGSLIRKTELLMPLLNKKRIALESELERAQISHKVMTESAEHKNKTLDPVIRQSQLNNSNAKITKIKKDLVANQAKIDELIKKDNDSPSHFEETLPIAASSSKMTIENRSFESEKMSHIIFNSVERETKNIQEEVEKFVSQLFSDETSTSCLPPSTLARVAASIESMLERENQISLVGSFITLQRVRTMDPIILRRNAVSNRLKKISKDYCVLTEAVLGALFLGVGRHVGGFGEKKLKEKEEEKTREVMSQVSMISFISQGAIPQPSKSAEDVNLWNVYTQWKEILKSDNYTGYPIGFKCRELQDVLRENGVDVDLTEDEEKEISGTK